MIFKAIKETLGQVFHSPEASGTWGTDDVKLPFWDDADIECAIDEEVVDCSEMDSPPYVGVPAPAYLEDDEWFGPAPVLTEKQEAYIQLEEATERLHEDMRKESGKVESENIHEELYKMASKNWNTVSETQGGSENFQEGPNGWSSGIR
tara:strand:+ start:2969 stop:3415 length:447 start_codon:yes stop_codon:yes gene_type:complete